MKLYEIYLNSLIEQNTPAVASIVNSTQLGGTIGKDIGKKLKGDKKLQTDREVQDSEPLYEDDILEEGKASTFSKVKLTGMYYPPYFRSIGDLEKRLKFLLSKKNKTKQIQDKIKSLRIFIANEKRATRVKRLYKNVKYYEGE